ncbi:uncharacterized protein LOC110716291 isoform X2 [Chenopodium quinoa]|uniref:Uncharacterized protein n=1 Tax=Chenopodium quinoa TaxID=63459 RepID=A0A803MNR4_CHEQI|nr:uncharacterized protein LOC110716291 isoform X2 [Chenopodium quinoa]
MHLPIRGIVVSTGANLEVILAISYLIYANCKSGDRSEKTSNLHSTDGDKNVGIGLQSASSIDHSDSGSSKCVYESYRPKLIALNGCCRSEASQLLHERWKGAIYCYSDPTVDLSERPVMYTGSSASAWGNFRLPHQLMAPPQMDFMAELQHAINNNSSSLMN